MYFLLNCFIKAISYSQCFLNITMIFEKHALTVWDFGEFAAAISLPLASDCNQKANIHTPQPQPRVFSTLYVLFMATLF